MSAPLPSDPLVWERWIAGVEGNVLPAPGGRAPVYQIEHPGVGSMVLRRYRHGGMFGWLLGDRFLGSGRFLAELSISEAIRASGVPSPEVLALYLKTLGAGVFRGWIVTRYVPDGLNLRRWAEMGPHGGPERREVIRLAARSVASLHDAGCVHRDLNLSNLLLASGKVFVLDLDGAREEHPLGLHSRGKNLMRLHRSLVKHTGRLEPLSLEERWLFLRAYTRGNPPLCRALWRFLKTAWGPSATRNALLMSIRRGAAGTGPGSLASRRKP